MFCLFRLTLAFILVSFSRQNERDSKRLLLNDPDVILARLNNMEHKMAQIQTELTEEKSKNVNLRQTIQNLNSPGSTYVRWGRTTCSGTHTELVYTGFTAGQNYYDPDVSVRFGGAANILCLPNNPELSNRTAPGGSFIYGTEYQENVFASGAVDEDVPCTVCRTSKTYTSIMIPGRKSCYGGWNKEYNGILASNRYNHKASSYICVDSSPEFVPGGKDNKNGNLLYATGTKCGSLTCPPYTDNMSVYCVVCSK